MPTDVEAAVRLQPHQQQPTPPAAPRRFLSSSKLQTAPSAQLSPGQEIEARLRRDVTFGFALVGGSHKKKTSSTSLSALHRPARGARSRGSSASLAPPTPEGVYVRSVETGSPAHSAGLQVGLRVLALNGISVQDATMAECASLMQQVQDMLDMVAVYDPFGFRAFDGGRLLRREVFYRLAICSADETVDFGTARHHGLLSLRNRRAATIDAAVNRLTDAKCGREQSVTVSLTPIALHLVYSKRKDYGNVILSIHDMVNVWLLGRKSVVIVTRELEPLGGGGGGGGGFFALTDDEHSGSSDDDAAGTCGCSKDACHADHDAMATHSCAQPSMHSERSGSSCEPRLRYHCHVLKCKKAKQAIDVKDALLRLCEAHVQRVQQTFSLESAA